ncbi:MAG TPA: hypothetical protein DCZ95_01620 [Verrucomicrobia bacterium]|nr:MAG: hypothetical protein A2X46_08645 [Lentisphaerae bacterium GWF2_57_35]HBA82768.1 hypothetical protein [Verrucomicrobiota bacterium]
MRVSVMKELPKSLDTGRNAESWFLNIELPEPVKGELADKVLDSSGLPERLNEPGIENADPLVDADMSFKIVAV